MNRADWPCIVGCVLPGVPILDPDFPDNKEEWPLLCGQDEIVVNRGASYLFLVNATLTQPQPAR